MNSTPEQFPDPCNQCYNLCVSGKGIWIVSLCKYTSPCLLFYSRALETVLWEHWPSTWPTIPSYPWRKWSGSPTASHQWASRHRGHNLHILTGRTCLRTFSNWFSSSLYWFYLIPDSIILLTALRFSSADWKGQESLCAYFRNPVCSCCTAVRWGGGGGSFKHSTAGLWPHTTLWPSHNALYWMNYMKFTAKHLEGIGLLAVFLLDFIRTFDVKWQHMKQSFSFETPASVLKHQGQCLAHNRTPYIEPVPVYAHVPQVWHCTLCFPTLSKVLLTKNRTRLLLRWTLKNVSSHIALNTG